MLHEFLITNREEILALVRAKTAVRSVPRATSDELDLGLPMFLTQLVEMLATKPPAQGEKAIGATASHHGAEMRRRGFTVGQVVQDYGQICQAITEIAVEQRAEISAEEFKTLNCCLDGAVAAAVTEFGLQRERSLASESNEHLGVLAHELRNALHTATLGFDALQSGLVGSGGSTSRVVLSSLTHMRVLLDRSLTDVRLKAGMHRTAPMSVAALIQEVAAAGAIDAGRRGLHLTVGAVSDDVMIIADEQILVAALTNLLQNAFKFTRPHGRVALRTSATVDRVRIEIEDECGGLPAGKSEQLFRLFEQRGADRTGIGLGLAISRRGVEDSGGVIQVRDLPGTGCIFIVSLPRQESGPLPKAASEWTAGGEQTRVAEVGVAGGGGFVDAAPRLGEGVAPSVDRIREDDVTDLELSAHPYAEDPA